MKKITCEKCGTVARTCYTKICRKCYMKAYSKTYKRVRPSRVCFGCGVEKPIHAKELCEPCYKRARKRAVATYTGPIRAGDMTSFGMVWSMDGRLIEVRSYAFVDTDEDMPIIGFVSEPELRSAKRYRPNPNGTLLVGCAA